MIKGLIFDKDGTLFEFGASWNAWGGQIIAALSNNDTKRHARLAKALCFDIERTVFYPNSLVIAGTLNEITEAICTALPDLQKTETLQFLQEKAQASEMAPVGPLIPLFTRFKEKQLKIGLITNDVIASTYSHLEKAGILTFFEFIAGSDSGFTPKPAPDALTHCAKMMKLAPNEIAMIGDSLHDLKAGRAAGMKTVGVLTGLAQKEELAPFADLVLPTICDIPQAIAAGWLA